MATLRDISRELGLSVTQVSRALNGHDDVSEETRARVQEIAKALKYQPNLTARKLATGKSGIVGLVLPQVPTAPEDTLFVQIVGGLSRHFSRRQMQFVLHIAAPEDDIIDVYHRLINSGSIDGFVVLEPRRDDNRITFLRERGVPFVVHGRHEAEPDYPYFDIDNVGVARTLTRFLTQRGHRQIVFLNGVAGRGYVEDRKFGYMEAIRAAGLPVDPDLHQNGEMTEGYGLVAAVRFWGGAGRGPTAVICNNTRIAKGVLDGLRALGRKVPDDVSVVAHDDALPGLMTDRFDPGLTCTYSPLEQSWEPLADILAGAVAGRGARELRQLGEIKLIERASVAILEREGTHESMESQRLTERTR
jgi:LacI family transcriptional regulator